MKKPLAKLNRVDLREVWKHETDFTNWLAQIVQPNEWAKAIKTNSSDRELTETNLQQLEFWKKFRKYVEERDKRIRLRTPQPRHWYDVSVGSSDYHVGLTINSRENLIGCEIHISNNKDLFYFLQERKDEIEKEIGEPLEWVDAHVASYIKLKKQVSDVFNPTEEENHFAWLYEKMLLFQKVFVKYFKEFKNNYREA